MQMVQITKLAHLKCFIAMECQVHVHCILFNRVTSPDCLVCHMVLSSSWLMKNLRKATAITLVHQSIKIGKLTSQS